MSLMPWSSEERDGQGFSIDIPVDNSQGAVTAAVQVDALKHDGTLDVDLHRRLSGDYTVPAATPEQPAYDADGNMLSYDGWTFAWNAQDRLVSATKGDVRLEFNYDYMGRRFEKKVYEDNALVKHLKFVYDGFKQIAEYDALANNALANTYLWQPVGLDVPLLRNGSEFCVSDANKNIVALLDTIGQVTDTYTYAPFGNCAHVGTSANPFRFSSECFDEETGLVYYNYRYYSQELGRWLSRDPVGEYSDINLYLMIYNNCFTFYDALGLRKLKLFYDLENIQNPSFNGFTIAHDLYNNPNGLFAQGFTLIPEVGSPFFSTLRDVKNDLQMRIGQYSENGEGECNCIKHLILAQHGTEGELHLGDQTLSSSDLHAWNRLYFDMIRLASSNVEKERIFNEQLLPMEQNLYEEINSFLNLIDQHICKNEPVYVDFLQCRAGRRNAGGTIIQRYLESYFSGNVTITLYTTVVTLKNGVREGGEIKKPGKRIPYRQYQ